MKRSGKPQGDPPHKSRRRGDPRAERLRDGGLRPFSCPRPAGDGRGLSSLPAAAPRGPGFEPQGLRSRVLGSGPALAAAARGNLSLPCHRVPAEEGEGRDTAFPVPPAWLDLRGLRFPGNSRAAAGPGSARGLLGAGPELFGTASQGKGTF